MRLTAFFWACGRSLAACILGREVESVIWDMRLDRNFFCSSLQTQTW